MSRLRSAQLVLSNVTELCALCSSWLMCCFVCPCVSTGLHQHAVKTRLYFPITHSCDPGFSSVSVTKNRFQDTVDAGNVLLVRKQISKPGTQPFYLWKIWYQRQSCTIKVCPSSPEAVRGSDRFLWSMHHLQNWRTDLTLQRLITDPWKPQWTLQDVLKAKRLIRSTASDS